MKFNLSKFEKNRRCFNEFKYDDGWRWLWRQGMIMLYDCCFDDYDDDGGDALCCC